MNLGPFLHTYSHTYIYAYMNKLHAYIHTYTHIYTYIHTYIHIIFEADGRFYVSAALSHGKSHPLPTGQEPGWTP
jgi:hypothetical protein